MIEVKNIYLVKDLAHITGVSIDSIKYYYKLGLFKEIGRSPSTNFRYFSDSAVEALREVRRLRAQNFSLKQIQAALQQKVCP